MHTLQNEHIITKTPPTFLPRDRSIFLSKKKKVSNNILGIESFVRTCFLNLLYASHNEYHLSLQHPDKKVCMVKDTDLKNLFTKCHILYG